MTKNYTNYTLIMPGQDEFDGWISDKDKVIKKAIKFNLSYRPYKGSPLTQWLALMNKAQRHRYVIHTPGKDIFVNPGDEVAFKVEHGKITGVHQSNR